MVMSYSSQIRTSKVVLLTQKVVKKAMNKEQYQAIMKSLETCEESIIESFDKFIQEIKNLREVEE